MDEGSILFAWKYADKCQLYLKTVISAVGGNLVFRKFQVYSSRTQGV